MLRVNVSTDVGVEIGESDSPSLAKNQRIGFRDGKRKLITEYVTEIDVPVTIEELGEPEWEKPTEIRVEKGKKITVPLACAHVIDAMVLAEHQRVQMENKDGGVDTKSVCLAIVKKNGLADANGQKALVALAGTAAARKAFVESFMKENPSFGK